MARVASPAQYLAMAAPSGVSVPARYCSRQLSTKARVAHACVLISARRKRMNWLSISALSKARRSLTCAMVQSSATSSATAQRKAISRRSRTSPLMA
ncbi:hypothetical protein D3C86_2014280 [compost metagenome]